MFLYNARVSQLLRQSPFHLQTEENSTVTEKAKPVNERNNYYESNAIILKVTFQSL